jgi:hypothetical protein
MREQAKELFWNPLQLLLARLGLNGGSNYAEEQARMWRK